MKEIFVKGILVLISVAAGLVTWLGSVYIWFRSGWSSLEGGAVWISQFSFIGWFIFGVYPSGIGICSLGSEQSIVNSSFIQGLKEYLKL
jgi:hypothetical protein